MNEQLLSYFNNDDLAASVWLGKYALKDKTGAAVEETPEDMHWRMANEFARVERSYSRLSIDNEVLSRLSKAAVKQRLWEGIAPDEVFGYFDRFRYIVPQGSIMSMLGNKYAVGSLSNCFVVPSPYDSYGGILMTDQHLAQLMKRRGGVGTNLNTLRPSGSRVTNAAGTSTGAVSFMHRYSNTTREVAQNGRRGALMLLISCLHPEVFDFVKSKIDRTAITGANISAMLTDKFMRAAENDEDFLCQFPVDVKIDGFGGGGLEYNKLTEFNSELTGKLQIMKIHARELFDLIVQCAWDNAEPGIAFIDRITSYCPEGVYPQFVPIASNPCFHPDTLIETINGRIKIKDIKEDMNVYSMDKNGKLCIRRASKSFISKQNTKTIKIKVRSGNEIQVTPEHKLFVHDKGWTEAKNLVLGDRIGHLCRSRRGAKYSGVYLTTDPLNRNGQVMEHRLVIGVNDLSLNVHHKNRNTYDNTISNLEILTHSEHAKITALEDNPQTHQVYGEKGRFVSTGKSRKTIVNLPNELKTGLTNQFSNAIISIEQGETTDVYDIQVSGTHCLIANNLVAHNCGEQFLQAYDACRLLALNLFGVVLNPFTKDAKIDEEKLYEIAYIQQRLADDIVDLEIEYIERIIKKIKADPEPKDVKTPELRLWNNIRNTAKNSRRTGCGFTALGDMLAALGVKYDSKEAEEIVEKVMKIKMAAELDCTIDLAILRGAFVGHDTNKEFAISAEGTLDYGFNPFYEMLLREFPEQSYRMARYGRRNVSWSTVAPTGTVSLMTQTTSGLEPLFAPWYFRKKKVNPSDAGVRVDFVDQNGDSWTEYPVLHPKFRDWLLSNEIFGLTDDIENISKDNLQKMFEKSPWYGSTANDIDWTQRVVIQSLIQRYTTNAISSTINLPEDVPQKVINDIYLAAWKNGLKGVTVYRDKCRTGVLTTETTTAKVNKFGYTDAVKRPKELDACLHIVKVRGTRYAVVVGAIDGNPYEVFAFPVDDSVKACCGKVVRVKSGHYAFVSDEVTLDNIQDAVHNDEQILTRFVSGMLRHGMNPHFINDQINKTPLEVVSFGKALTRVLKTYIKEEELVGKIKCTECGSANIRLEEGCSKCLDCGHSACG